MLKSVMAAESFPPHPVMEKLLAEGVDVSDVMSLAGYAGPTTRGGPVRLFPSLRDLSVYVEIPADEILHVEKAAETALPNDGIIVWLRNDSAVILKVLTYDREESYRRRTLIPKNRFDAPAGRAGFIYEPCIHNPSNSTDRWSLTFHVTSPRDGEQLVDEERCGPRPSTYVSCRETCTMTSGG